MLRAAVHEGGLAACAECGASWLDSDACRALAESRLGPLARAFVGSESSRESRIARTVFRDLSPSLPDRLACPQCDTILLPRYLRDANATVRVCPEHGTFFRRRVLGRVLEAVDIRAAALATPIALVPALLPRPTAGGFVLRIGALLFALSMVLPACHIRILGTGDTIPGFLCALFGFAAIEGEPLIALGAIANVWLVTYPIYGRHLRARGLVTSAVVALSAGLITLAISFGPAKHDLTAGYFVWMSSFFVICAGLTLRAAKSDG